MARLIADAAVTVTARHVGVQHAARHAPRRVLRICQRIQIDHRRAQRRREMHGAAVVREQQVGRFDQRAELADRQRAGQWQHALAGARANSLDERALVRAARHRYAVEIPGDARDDVREALGGPAPRRRARARMNDEPAAEVGGRIG